MTGDEIAAAAKSLVGVPFRLHGRDRRIGLDCLGVVALAHGGAMEVPATYRLRALEGGERDSLVAAAARSMGLAPADGPAVPGDVLMLRPGACQLHFAVAVDRRRIVHPHAGLGRVVLGPIPEDWPLAGLWRQACDPIT